MLNILSYFEHFSRIWFKHYMVLLIWFEGHNLDVKTIVPRTVYYLLQNIQSMKCMEWIEWQKLQMYYEGTMQRETEGNNADVRPTVSSTAYYNAFPMHDIIWITRPDLMFWRKQCRCQSINGTLLRILYRHPTSCHA